ncbi:MAG: thioesterase, FlK family [Burkholderiaceae bacterium]
MNTLQKLGALFFEEQYCVPTRAGNNLATLAAAAPAGATSFAAGSLVQALERMCERQVKDALDDPDQGVATAQVALVHRAPVLPGAQLFVRAWVQRVGWDVVSFELEVRDRYKLVCEGTLTLALQRVVAIARKPLPPPARQAAPRHAPLFGLFSPAMAGRALPALLWGMASVMLVAVTLFALAPNLERRAQNAAQAQQDRANAAAIVDSSVAPQLSHPLRTPVEAKDSRNEQVAHGG